MAPSVIRNTIPQRRDCHDKASLDPAGSESEVHSVFRVILSTSGKQPRTEAIVYALDVSWKTLINNSKGLVLGFC